MYTAYPLKFEPIYQNRVWGGDAFATRLGRIPSLNGPQGESWDLVDRSLEQSKIITGTYAGHSLR